MRNYIRGQRKSRATIMFSDLRDRKFSFDANKNLFVRTALYIDFN